MKLYPIKTPRIIKKLFPAITWSFASNKKNVYLTFDDGPIPQVTEFVLDELLKAKAKATFFCIGDNVRKHPEIFARILTEGHSVGNHTFNHLNGWKTSTISYLENVDLAEDLIQQLNNFVNPQQKLFRPPYGKIKRSQAKELVKKGYKIIMWDVLSADFDTKISKEKCLKNVLNNVNDGSIIVFHDSLKASEKLYYALPVVLKKLSEKGYSFKAIS